MRERRPQPPPIAPAVAIEAWKKLLRALAGLALVLAACGGKLPETRFYQLAAPAAPAPQPPGDLVIALESFDTDAGYDDDRIVYRTTPYRMDYYQYHRWSAAPDTPRLPPTTNARTTRGARRSRTMAAPGASGESSAAMIALGDIGTTPSASPARQASAASSARIRIALTASRPGARAQALRHPTTSLRR